MARTTKRGKCELCGEVANVGTNHGSATCPKCTHVQAALANRLQAVAKAARAMGKAEDLIKALIPDGGSLAVQVTATLLQEISGIVGYEGEDPAELVEAVRGAIATKKATALDCGDCDLAGCFNKLAELVDQRGASAGQVVEAVRRRALACASCEAEDVLHEIREIVGYVPDQGDKGLADAVRRVQAKASSVMDCAECTTLRDDLLRACGLEMDDTEDGEGWDVAVAAAIQTIAELLNIQYDLAAIILRAHETIDNLRNEISRLNGQTHSESEQVTALRTDLSRSSEVVEQLRAEITLLKQAHDEWEQLAVEAKDNVETLEAELRNREDAPAAPCASTTYLLDIALRALRGEGPDADQLATIIDAARRAA